MKTFKQYIDQGWEYNGNSAQCLYGIFTGHTVKLNIPHDPDDLCRVLQCMRLMPLDRRREILRECADFYDSEEWRTLYHNWNELMDIFSKEWNSNSAPKTYDFMNKLYKECRTR